MKKIISLFAVLILLAVSGLNASAEVSLKTDRDFIVYSKDNSPEEAAEILDITAKELEKHCRDNNIIYFAVDRENKRQIKLTAAVTDFSSSVGNLNSLSGDSVSKLMSEIIGDDRADGKLISKDGQSFVKTQLSLTDSGGSYTLISYITVAEKTEYVLSVSIEDGLPLDFADEVFNTLSSDSFITEEKTDKPLMIIIPSAILLFTAAAGYIIFTLIKDIKRDKHN